MMKIVLKAKEVNAGRHVSLIGSPIIYQINSKCSWEEGPSICTANSPDGFLYIQEMDNKPSLIADDCEVITFINREELIRLIDHGRY